MLSAQTQEVLRPPGNDDFSIFNRNKPNDDYATERAHALRDVKVDVLPLNVFHRWLESKGKMGGQNKFPRVMKKSQLEDWKAFISGF